MNKDFSVGVHLLKATHMAIKNFPIIRQIGEKILANACNIRLNKGDQDVINQHTLGYPDTTSITYRFEGTKIPVNHCYTNLSSYFNSSDI